MPVLVSESRADGRSALSVRDVSLVPGGSGANGDRHGGASGSALFCQGCTRVFATVFGPHESTSSTALDGGVERGALNVRVTIAPFSSRARALGAASPAAAVATTDEERVLESALSAALVPSVLLERLPKAVIDVHVLILEADGGELAAAVTAASAALVDAGVEVRDAVVGARVLLNGSGEEGDVLADPTAVEADGKPVATIAVMPSLRLITSASHVGDVEPTALVRAFQLALDAAVATHAALRPGLLSLAANNAI
jgi:exosome complex component MTR3